MSCSKPDKSSVKPRNKSAVTITPAQRVKEFGVNFTSEGGMLWCKLCNVTVDHIRRQTITDHINSKRYGDRIKRQAEDAAGPPNKKQATIPGCNDRATAASAAQEKVVMDLVAAFMAANIPLEKLDNPTLREFVKLNVKGGGAVPKANTLRDIYVQKVYIKQHEAIVQFLTDKKVAVIVDETTDTVGRYVVNILVQPLAGFGSAECKAKLINTEFLPAVNNVSIAQLIIRTLTNANIDFNNVLALISDNAAYMKKCFTNCLRGLWPNAVHVTCWAHILSLVGEEFRGALKLCDELVINMKGIFSKAPGRRARYLAHLRENNVSKIALPPVPVITRWNTWFAAALYHANHLQYYKFFVTKEIDDIGGSVQLRKLTELLQGEQAEILRAELEFISLHCERLMNALTSVESQSLLSVHVYNKMFDLHAWLRNPGFPYATSDCEDAMIAAANKLAEYVEGTKQPAIALFKAVRLFDFRQVPVLSKTFADYIPIISQLAAVEQEWACISATNREKTITDRHRISIILVLC